MISILQKCYNDDQAFLESICSIVQIVKVKVKVYSVEDVTALQFDLCNLVEWSEEWQMLFNADKCRVMHMHMGYNNKLADYHINDVKLECVSEEKDLGVIISEDLKCEKQCCEAVKKANRMLGMIKSEFHR